MPLVQSFFLGSGHSLVIQPPSLALLGLEAWRTLMHSGVEGRERKRERESMAWDFGFLGVEDGTLVFDGLSLYWQV